MTTAVSAWILTDNAGLAFAVAEVEMIEYLIAPSTFAVPQTPDYCTRVMPWRDQLLPIIQLNKLLKPDSYVDYRHIGVLAYQNAPGQDLKYIAVALGQSPYRVSVSDRGSAPIPDIYRVPAYRPLVRSVFRLDEIQVPVLDVAYLASITLRDAMLAPAEALAE